MHYAIIEQHVAEMHRLLDSLCQNDRTCAIAYHGDCDGVVSATLLAFTLRRHFGVETITLLPVRTEEFDFLDVISKLKTIKPDITFFMDLSIQDYPKRLEEAASATRLRTIIYDHHSQHQTSIPSKTEYYNPSITPAGHDPQSPPPCFFAARLCSTLLQSDFDWFSCIGLIGEGATERFLALFRQSAHRFPRLFPNGQPTSVKEVYIWKLPRNYLHNRERIFSTSRISGTFCRGIVPIDA